MCGRRCCSAQGTIWRGWTRRGFPDLANWHVLGTDDQNKTVFFLGTWLKSHESVGSHHASCIAFLFRTIGQHMYSTHV